MHYHIILTERCNSRCRYCYEKSMNEFENGLEEKWDYDDTPVDSEVSIKNLKRILKEGDTLIFYGGEPLVQIEKIKQIMEGLKDKKINFRIQTNGKLLNKFDFSYLKKVGKMLVSIDGDKEKTDFNRGKGTYEIVINNLKELRTKGYGGEIVARMVISGFPDLYEQVKHIFDLGLFDSVHWQIDAGFYKNDFNFEEFSNFVEKYNESVNKLLDYWIKNMNQGKVLKIYPFIGIFDRIKEWDKETRLPCGSGYANYTITTNGNLVACPIMSSVKNFYCGSLDKGVEKEIKIRGCDECSYYEICGGRCLYWKEAKLWPKEGDELICKTIKYLIDSIKERVEEIDSLIDKEIIRKEDFEYEKYFGPEIIP